MKNLKFAIIGAGNMGSAVAEGLLKTGKITAGNIFLTDKRPHILDSFKPLGLQTGENNQEAAGFADAVIIAVKPYHVKSVLEEIKAEIVPKKKLLIIIAAGVSISDIEEVTGKIPIFRTMPNTAISIQESRNR